jgi:biopolymer transport protein ExbB
LADFPLLVVLRFPPFEASKLKADGSDLRFIAADQTTVLTYHTEAWGWNAGGPEFAWVRIPDIPAFSSDMHLWVYYGNANAAEVRDPGGTYDAWYDGVWHLDELVSDEQSGATHLDATSPSNDGTQYNNDNTTGQMARGQSFDGSGDYVRVPDNPQLNLGDTWTLETWINPSRLPNDWQAVLSKDLNSSQTNRAPSLFTYYSYAELWYSPYESRVLRSSSTLSIGTWTHLAATYDNGYVVLYFNGVAEDWDFTYAPAGNTYDWYLAQRGNNGAHYYFSGSLDEVRMSSVARSEDWIYTQHLSMTEQLVSVGDEEAQCTP